MRALLLRPAARLDLDRAYQWYEQEKSGLGEDFLAEIAAGLELIQANPQIFPVVHRKTRRAPVRRFPYALFFQLTDTAVIVVACYHLRRDPAGWKDRR